MQMNYSRLFLAAFGGMVAYYVFGSLLFVLAPFLVNESRKFATVFRPKEEMMKVMPIGLIATFIAILVVTVIFTMIHPGGAGAAAGANFGLLIGIFVVCGFVLHNYVILNIGLKLTIGNAAAYFAQWLVVCIVIAMIYKPVATP